jgi:hypothetical protein
LDLRKNILDTMIYLMECGCVLPVLKRIQHWTSKIDQSLLRHFVIKVRHHFHWLCHQFQNYNNFFISFLICIHPFSWLRICLV